jgi:hypothetical protein
MCEDGRTRDVPGLHDRESAYLRVTLQNVVFHECISIRCVFATLITYSRVALPDFCTRKNSIGTNVLQPGILAASNKREALSLRGEWHVPCFIPSNKINGPIAGLSYAPPALR